MGANEAAYDKALSNFDPIDSCVNVDCVCAEDGKAAHVRVVEGSCLESSSHYVAEHRGH